MDVYEQSSSPSMQVVHDRNETIINKLNNCGKHHCLNNEKYDDIDISWFKHQICI